MTSTVADYPRRPAPSGGRNISCGPRPSHNHRIVNVNLLAAPIGSKIALKLSRMGLLPSIFPCLPRYPGPFQVGSIDVEIPLSESKKFDTTETSVETILVRLFYPADANELAKPTAPAWLPQPSMEYAKGYASFLKQ